MCAVVGIWVGLFAFIVNLKKKKPTTDQIKQALKKKSGCLLLVDPFRLNDENLLQEIHALGFQSCLFEFSKEFIALNETESNVKVKRAKLLIAYYDELHLPFHLSGLKQVLRQRLHLIELE